MNIKKILIVTNCITLLTLGYLVYKKVNQQSKVFTKQPCTYNLKDIKYLEGKEVDSPMVIMIGDSRVGFTNWNRLLNRSDVLNRGINGDKLYCVCERIDIIKTAKPKICFIEGGVLDLYSETPDSIFNSFKTIIDFCKQQNVIPVVNAVVKIAAKASPLYKEANAKIDELNKKLLLYAKENNIDYIDLNPQLVSGNEQTLSDAFSADGIHFNDTAYKIWATHINPILLKYHL